MKKYLLTLIALMLLSAVSVGVANRIFFGSAVVNNSIIQISSDDLRDLGYDKIVDSIIMPHIKYNRAFNFYAQHINLPQRIKTGRYELKDGASVIDIARMLKLGVQTPTTLTFNNIRTPEQLAGRLASQIEADSATILSAFSSPKVLAKIGAKNKEELLAIFIPNTYQIYWDTTPEELVERMNREYKKFWNEARDRKRKALNLTRLNVSTLASILYEETNKEDEMPRIAGVYINRLRRGMKLQADPTVKYAMGDFELKRVLFKHLTHPSPYNTYRHRGLPPTPIAMPSIAAIDAVLNYESHKYLYFCARPELDGYHNFAATLVQHNANSRAYSKELNRRNIK